ncbi:MAG: hypothetical protein K6L76_04595 [Agarilytica sp.]
MENWQISIIVALVGLLGTLLGLFIGFKKWNYEKNREKREEYIKDRQNAYKSLWEKLEHLHAEIRKGEFDAASLRDLRFAFNSHVLSIDIYLDTEDRKYCNEYLSDVEAVAKGVAESGNASLQDDWAITAAFPEEHGNALQAFASMETRRSYLINKIKQVLQEERA